MNSIEDWAQHLITAENLTKQISKKLTNSPPKAQLSQGFKVDIAGDIGRNIEELSKVLNWCLKN